MPRLSDQRSEVARRRASLVLLLLATVALVWPRVGAFYRGFAPESEIFNRRLTAWAEIADQIDLMLPMETPILWLDTGEAIAPSRPQQRRYVIVRAALAPRRITRLDSELRPKLVLMKPESDVELSQIEALEGARLVASLGRGVVLLERTRGCTGCPP